MATQDELLSRLSDAETALHNLLIGKQTIRLEYDGKSVTYSQSSIGDLRAYITELKVQTGQMTSRSRAGKVYF